jgi:ketosteroid isomerase-like protein
MPELTATTRIPGAQTSHSRRSTRLLTAGAGALGAIGLRTLLARLLLLEFRRQIRALNAGNHKPALSSFAEDAVLHFNTGEHRWAGDHRGKAAIDRFLRNFVGAGLKGEIRELFFSGPLWRMTLIARFDDHAHGPAGEELYRNRTLLLSRTRWGRIVEHDDFYQDTERIATFDRRLRELGVEPVE